MSSLSPSLLPTGVLLKDRRGAPREDQWRVVAVRDRLMNEAERLEMHARFSNTTTSHRQQGEEEGEDAAVSAAIDEEAHVTTITTQDEEVQSAMLAYTSTYLRDRPHLRLMLHTANGSAQDLHRELMQGTFALDDSLWWQASRAGASPHQLFCVFYVRQHPTNPKWLHLEIIGAIWRNALLEAVKSKRCVLNGRQLVVPGDLLTRGILDGQHEHRRIHMLDEPNPEFHNNSNSWLSPRLPPAPTKDNDDEGDKETLPKAKARLIALMGDMEHDGVLRRDPFPNDSDGDTKSQAALIHAVHQHILTSSSPSSAEDATTFTKVGEWVALMETRLFARRLLAHIGSSDTSLCGEFYQGCQDKFGLVTTSDNNNNDDGYTDSVTCSWFKATALSGSVPRDEETWRGLVVRDGNVIFATRIQAVQLLAPMLLYQEIQRRLLDGFHYRHSTTATSQKPKRKKEEQHSATASHFIPWLQPVHDAFRNPTDRPLTMPHWHREHILEGLHRLQNTKAEQTRMEELEHAAACMVLEEEEKVVVDEDNTLDAASGIHLRKKRSRTALTKEEMLKRQQQHRQRQHQHDGSGTASDIEDMFSSRVAPMPPCMQALYNKLGGGGGRTKATATKGHLKHLERLSYFGGLRDMERGGTAILQHMQSHWDEADFKQHMSLDSLKPRYDDGDGNTNNYTLGCAAAASAVRKHIQEVALCPLQQAALCKTDDLEAQSAILLPVLNNDLSLVRFVSERLVMRAQGRVKDTMLCRVVCFELAQHRTGIEYPYKPTHVPSLNESGEEVLTLVNESVGVHNSVRGYYHRFLSPQGK